MENKFEALRELQKSAYCPYSKFQVAAILIDKKNQEYKGVNVENASYGGTICAERSSIVSAISQGINKDDLREIHLIGGTAEDFVMPCGLCRQFMSEFMHKGFPVVVYRADGSSKVVEMGELLPYSFSGDDIK
jgi:cytidine deaminase